MAPIEEVLPSEGQEFMKEVGNTRTEQAQEQRAQRQNEQAPATDENGEEAQNQVNTTA